MQYSLSRFVLCLAPLVLLPALAAATQAERPAESKSVPVQNSPRARDTGVKPRRAQAQKGRRAGAQKKKALERDVEELRVRRERLKRRIAAIKIAKQAVTKRIKAARAKAQKASKSQPSARGVGKQARRRVTAGRRTAPDKTLPRDRQHRSRRGVRRAESNRAARRGHQRAISGRHGRRGLRR